MQKRLPSISTRTPEFTPQELPLPTPEVPRQSPVPDRRPADRIKDALLRWLEEEL